MDKHTPSIARALLASAVVGLALLTGCSIGGNAQSPVVNYDLGPVNAPSAGSKPLGKTMLVTPVASPTWLDHTTMMYRLNQADPTRPRYYSASRWSGTPAEMLTERLRARLARSVHVVTETEGVSGDYSLRLDLEEFAQIFPQPDTSRVDIRVRATLIDTERRVVLMQKTFEALEAAPPNAPGAVPVYAQAAGRIIDEVAIWTEQAISARQTTTRTKP